APDVITTFAHVDLVVRAGGRVRVKCARLTLGLEGQLGDLSRVCVHVTRDQNAERAGRAAADGGDDTAGTALVLADPFRGIDVDRPAQHDLGAGRVVADEEVGRYGRSPRNVLDPGEICGNSRADAAEPNGHVGSVRRDRLRRRRVACR